MWARKEMQRWNHECIMRLGKIGMIPAIVTTRQGRATSSTISHCWSLHLSYLSDGTGTCAGDSSSHPTIFIMSSLRPVVSLSGRGDGESVFSSMTELSASERDEREGNGEGGGGGELIDAGGGVDFL
jgi:hypothetical protein